MKSKVFRIITVLALCLTLIPAALALGSHDCVDADADHFCDECWESVTTHCADGDGDHYCDVCYRQVRTDCTDGNGDTWCDVCGGHLIQYCADGDKNHLCDGCWALLSTCTDENKDHLCDICGGVFWVDADGDGVCDGCDAVLTHVTATHKEVYYHTKDNTTVADVVLEVAVAPYIEVGGAPAGTVQVRWTDGDGRSYTTAERALTFGATTVTVEYPSLPMSALELGGRVTFTPYDAGFTPAENGCIIEYDLPGLSIGSDSACTVNGVRADTLYLLPGTGVTVVQEPGRAEHWEWVFEEDSARPELTTNGLTTTFVMPGEDVALYAAWRCELCTDADGDNRCDVCEYYVEAPIYVGGVELADGWYLSNDGTVSETQPEGGWARFADGVLTLNGYVYEGPGVAVDGWYKTNHALIYSEDSLNIRVEAESSLTNTAVPAPLDYCDGILAVGNLVITGAKLSVTALDNAVYSESGTVTVINGDLSLGAGSAGIDSCDDVLVIQSKLGIYSEEDGIYVYDGDVLLLDSVVAIAAGEDGVYLYEGGLECSGSEVLIEAGNNALFAYTYLTLGGEQKVLLPEGGKGAEKTVFAGTAEEYTYHTIVDPNGEAAQSVILTVACPSTDFADVEADAWYHDGVDYVLEHDLMESAGADTFAPKEAADRATFVHALWKMAGSPVVNYIMPFSDVDGLGWDTEAIRWAAAMGIATGYPDGTFRPAEAITRQEMATFLYRYEQTRGGGFEGAWMFLLDYTDRADVAEWAYEPLCWLTMKGLMQGDGTGALNPKSTATRAEMAQIIKNYMEFEG